ncbi:MAG: hypothetical protein IPK81_24325 [Rhodospirillales bacterium]|nr:MAG: hypothetical protein IPK81_24325 [Rhodospirillales bacterium]
MIGYAFDAYSNTGFTHSVVSWTEGELWMSYALKKTAPKPLGKTVTGLMDGITDQFAAWKKPLMQAVAGVSTDFLLFGWDGAGAHALFTYRFQKDDPAEYTAAQFVRAIKRGGNDFGDQVMITLCDTIRRFEEHLVLNRGAVERVGIPCLHTNIAL